MTSIPPVAIAVLSQPDSIQGLEHASSARSEPRRHDPGYCGFPARAHSQTGKKALTEVKTGDAWRDIDSYGDHAWHIFLFQSKGHYDGRKSNHVTAISRDELADFLEEHVQWLPLSFWTKLEMVAEP